MRKLEQLQCLSQQEVDLHKTESQNIIKSLNKNEVNSIKAMILPPMFTFNVLKIVFMLQNRNLAEQEITWNTIKKQLLVSSDNFQRKCQNISLEDFDDDDINKLQNVFQDTFRSFGENVQTKAELYGTFIHKICRFCLKTRTVLHGSKFLRCQD